MKGTKQKIIVIHNPSEIDKNQFLLVRFPDLVMMLSFLEQRIYPLTLNYSGQLIQNGHW